MWKRFLTALVVALGVLELRAAPPASELPAACGAGRQIVYSYNPMFIDYADGCLYQCAGGAWSLVSCPGSGTGAPLNATYITQTLNGTLTAEQALASLATGLLKNTTGTGVLTIAIAGTDYVIPTDLSTNDGTANQAGDPVSWFKLKDIPAGFLDGTDDGGGSFDSTATTNVNWSNDTQASLVHTYKLSGGSTDPTLTANSNGLEMNVPLTVGGCTDNNCGWDLIDNSLECGGGAAGGKTRFCSVLSEPHWQDTGGTVREVLWTAGGSYNFFSCTNGTCAMGSAVVGATELAATAVTPAQYNAAKVTFDADGRATAAQKGTFVDMADTPVNYTGSDGKGLKVSGSAVVFADTITLAPSDFHGIAFWGVATGTSAAFDTGTEVCAANSVGGGATMACVDTYDVGSASSVACGTTHSVKFLAFCK